jgi:hypothetical protein
MYVHQVAEKRPFRNGRKGWRPRQSGASMLGQEGPMDTIRSLADHSIRRVLGCVALAIALVMAGLSTQPLLALQSGSLLTAAVWLGLWGMAVQVLHSDPRSTPFWPRIVLAGEAARRWQGREGRRRLAAILSERLMWHADRTALAAVALGGVTLAMFGLRALRG